jgi:hypothetical protein
MFKKLLIMAALCFFVTGLVMAQGTSPVKVNRITVTPASFKIGDTLSFSIEIENTSTSAYACVNGTYFKAFLHVFKATPYRIDNQLWETSQPLTTNLAPHERRTVTFTARWTVPNIVTDKFIFMAGGPICAPDEFNQSTVITFYQTCTYTALATIRPEVIRIAAKDILKKK